MKAEMNGTKNGLSRRDFVKASAVVGAAAVSLSGCSADLTGAGGVLAAPAKKKAAATVRGAFIYPPTESLRQAGYYSWPGSTFNAEGRQQEYMRRLSQMEARLGMKILMDEQPLDDGESVTRFINDVKASKPDGLLLIPFKKGHWGHVTRIVDETQTPSVVLATLGILLVDHINQFHEKQGVYLINSMDNLDAVEEGMNMIRTARWMKEAVLADIRGAETKETKVPHLGTTVRTIPGQRFIDEFNRTQATEQVKALADRYRRGAKKVIQPSRTDILDAARTYFVLRRIIEQEKADAVMMDCLPGLQLPHRHPPPCMGFMSLRDEGIAAGCQSDLNATLTLMLVQELFDKPGFQQNASMETEKDHYFGAHCTCASKLGGTSGLSEPYILMNHAEAGWGCVPRVLWCQGQQVTMAQYLSGQSPQMYVYSGRVVDCPDITRAGGCRTNVEIIINEVEDACDVKGMHQVIFYGDYAKQLKTFCRLCSIEAVI